MTVGRTADWWHKLQRAPKLVCLARTFPKHAQELGNPVPSEPIFFLKSPSSVIRDGAAIRLPAVSHLVHHEAEVAAVIRSPLQHASSNHVLDALLGFTVLNDVTARDLQRDDNGRFSRAKSFDTFCPMSQELITDVDWQKLSIGCTVNGETRQMGSLTQLVQSPFELIAWLSTQLQLLPGDVVALGTPHGVGPLCSGDQLSTTLYVDGQPRLQINNAVHRP